MNLDARRLTSTEIDLRCGNQRGTKFKRPLEPSQLNQAVNGTLSATTLVGDGSALTGVSKITSVTPGSGLAGGGNAGSISLAVDATVARTNAGNTFTGNQAVNGNLTVSGDLNSGGSLTIGGGTPIARHLSTTATLSFPLRACNLDLNVAQ